MRSEEAMRSVSPETNLMGRLSGQAERTYEATYQQLHSTSPPQVITFGASHADVLSMGRGFMGAFDLTRQTQVGCPAGCLFCYVPNEGLLTPSAVRGPSRSALGLRGAYQGGRPTQTSQACRPRSLSG